LGRRSFSPSPHVSSAPALGCHAAGRGHGPTREQDSKTLGTVIVKQRAEAAAGQHADRAAETGIGKGRQPLRDVTQPLSDHKLWRIGSDT